MRLSEAKKIGLFRFKIDISSFLGKDPGTLFITMGEPDIADSKRLSEQSEDDIIALIPELMEKYMAEHPFDDEKGEASSAAEVVSFITSIPEMFTHVVKEWTENLPLAKKSARKSASTAAPSLPEASPTS